MVLDYNLNKYSIFIYISNFIQYIPFLWNPVSFLWIPVDSGPIPVDSCPIPVDSSGFQWNHHIPAGMWGHREVLKKRDEKGKLIKYKAQLITQGFSQKPGIDFKNDGTFAPVMQFETLHTFLAFAASMKWDIKQFDVKGAYLYGLLKESIFMDQPCSFNDGSIGTCM